MRKTLRLLAALAILALISAGCSTAPAGAGIGSSGNSIVMQSLSPSSTSAGAGPGSSAGKTTTATHSNAPAETGAGSASSQITAAPSKTSSNAPADSSGGNTAATREQAVQFAQCMRKNGVRGFPDPDTSGNLTIDQIANGSALDTNSAAFKQAISACNDLEPPGFTGVKRSPEQQKAALQFAQCIRDNGVKDFPDPAPDGPLVDTNRIPSAARNGGMSMLNAAMHKCGDFAANAGVSRGQ